METLKIAIVGNTANTIPPKGYGGEIFYWLLCMGLAELGHEVTLYAPPGSKTPPSGKLKLIRPTYGKASLAGEAEVWQNYGSEIIKHDFIISVQHNHVVSEKIRFYHPEVMKKVVNVLNGIVSIYPRPEPYNLIVGSESWKECLVKGISQFYGTFWAQLYGEFIPPVKEEAIAGVIPWAVDVSSFPYKEEKEEYFLYFSRPTPYKGLHNFIKLARLNPNERFIASYNLALEDHKYWHGKYKPAIESTDNIELILDPTPEQKKELMANAKAVIFPIECSEPFGLVPLEAMAMGTAVIATSLGALPEFVKEGGILCGYSSEKQGVNLNDFINAMQSIDRVKPRNARKNAERYNYKLVVPKYLEIFNNSK